MAVGYWRVSGRPEAYMAMPIDSHVVIARHCYRMLGTWERLLGNSDETFLGATGSGTLRSTSQMIGRDHG